MKVLFYLERYPAFGGIERITSELSYLFHYQLGYEIGIYSFLYEESLLNTIPTYVRFYNPNLPLENQKSTLEDSIIEFQPDVIIFQDSYAPIENELFNIKGKINNKFKLITVEHNIPICHLKEYIFHWHSHSWLKPKSFLKRLIFPYIYFKLRKNIGKRHKLLISNSDEYILLSNSYKKILKKYWNINTDKIKAIPNIRKDFGIENPDLFKKKKQILFVGRLTQQKGIKYLVQIWEIIEKRYPEWNLVIIGDGELRDFLRAEIQIRNLKNIRMDGFRNDMENIYQESSVLFMTSIYEGLPLVIAEAMHFGVIPFVFDSFSSIHDIINEESGFIIPPFDINKFVNTFDSYVKGMSPTAANVHKKSHDFAAHSILEKWKELIEI